MLRNTTEFRLQVSTSNGTLDLPQINPSITLSGRQSKVIVTDYAFGTSRALYSTASVLFAGQIGSRDVLFLFGDADQEHEAAIPFTGKSGVRAASSSIKFTPSGESSSSETIVSVLSGVRGLVTLWDSDTQLVLYSDSDTASTFFAPVIPSTSTSGDEETFKNYWQFGTNSTALIGGPYLVRNVSISGSTLNIRGDLNATAMLNVVAPPQVKRVTWNGQEVEPMAKASSALSTVGGFVGQVSPRVSANAIRIPKLESWKFADSLPEIQSDFSDDSWLIANHTTTNIPFKPYYGDGRVLYGCDYGL